MIEKTLLTYLNNTLSVRAYTQVPKDAPSEYVLFEKTRGSVDDLIKTSQFAIQSISSQSLLNAAELNEEVKTAMDNFITEDEVCKSKLNSDYNFTDATTKVYRYQAVYDVVHY